MISGLMQSHRVGSLFGFEVRIAYSLYFFMGILALGDLMRIQSFWGLFLILPYLLMPVFVLAHELGHCFAAIKEGARVRSILLTPLGGLAQLEGGLGGPGGEIMVALAGPFVSLLLAAIFVAPRILLGLPFLEGGILAAVLTYAMLMNLYLALFNLLPIFPMDGGRVAAAAAVIKLGPDRGLHAITKISRVGFMLLAVYGVVQILQGNVVGGIIPLMIAYFLYTRGQQELQARMYAQNYLGGGVRQEPLWRYGAEEWRAASDEDPWQEPDAQLHKASDPGWWARWRAERSAKKEAKRAEQNAEMRAEVDRILAKVKAEGIQSLTPKERDTLNRASQDARRNKQ